MNVTNDLKYLPGSAYFQWNLVEDILYALQNPGKHGKQIRLNFYQKYKQITETI